MASSRWKRFAFFERHTLDLKETCLHVLQDLIPVDSDVTKSRRSIRSLQAAGQEAGDDSIGLVATTAALPLDSKPKLPSEQQHQQQQQQQQQDGDAMTAMWSSLTACTSPSMTATTTTEDDTVETIRLPTPPKGESSLSSSSSSSTTAVDGLVLAFVTSRSTELIHCFDLTARCNPPATTTAAPADEISTESSERVIEDLDGWRGYFAPFSFQPAVVERRTSQDIIHEHMMDETSGSGAAANAAISDRVIAIAACRDVTAHKAVLMACIARGKVALWEDPHLHLSCRRPLTCPKAPLDAKVYSLSTKWNATDGECRAVDVKPSLVAVGTTNGYVIVYSFDTSSSSSSKKRTLRSYLRIPPPPSGDAEVVSVKLSLPSESGEENDDGDKASVTVSYRRKVTESTTASAGICCYEFPLPTPSSTTISAPSARHDLDGRSVASASLVDAFSGPHGLQFTVARLDGLYSYSKTERIGVAPIDGIKLSISIIPPPIPAKPIRKVDLDEIGSGYALVASTDSKSGRDSVDIYDAHNKLVAFHLLLSPGHSAVRSAGITTTPTLSNDGTLRSGRSSAIVLTSGGHLVTLTEKLTAEKISLLVQKNLYSAAIVVAYADPSYDADDITNLYRQYAEHLYRKGDFGGAMAQYIHTIGSLESSHVLYRYLDAPKIPHLVKYLEQLRTRGLATPVHNELLRTCYLKLNDTDAAEALAASGSRSMDKGSLATILAKIPTHPKEALATICSLEARQAAEVLVVHGASLARGLPRELAGVIISLCLGTYSPKSLADAALSDASDLKKMIEKKVGEDEMVSKPYPVHLFASAFVEHPKLLRLILAHCNRNKCPLTPSLRRTLLELTLAEWNQAKRTGDTEAEKLRHKEAIAALTDSHCKDIGDYDALVIVQQAGFEEGELLLYERLQMTPMLLERYAKDGSEKSRRQMLALCKTDPEVLADVLGHLVSIASEKAQNANAEGRLDDDSEQDELEEIMDDIQEGLVLARCQGVLPPVRIARILAGESSGQFSIENSADTSANKGSIPLSVALDYVGSILEESRQEISRLTAEVEEYNTLSNEVEKDIDALLRVAEGRPPSSTEAEVSSRMNIDDLYAKMRAGELDMERRNAENQTEAFWREMNQSEDSFEAIARFFAKGIIN